jgi:hypothetical protein
MNGVGSWCDNAPMESFFGTLKSELVHQRTYHTHDEARPDLFFYIEAFYNRRRRHSALDYLSPEAYEQLYHQRLSCLTPCPPNRGGSENNVEEVEREISRLSLLASCRVVVQTQLCIGPG